MSYLAPKKTDWVKCKNEFHLPLQVGTKAYVRYEDTSCGIVCRIATVTERDEMVFFDNGYENPIFNVIDYAVAVKESEEE